MTKKGKNPRPHVLYGHMKEKELINLIKETAATYKTRQGGRIYEMKQELERRRMLTLKRKNPENNSRVACLGLHIIGQNTEPQPTTPQA